MKNMAKILVLSCLLITVTAGFADNSTPVVANQGIYVGGDLGMGSSNCNNCAVDMKLSELHSTTSSTSNSDAAFNIFGGYQLNSYVAFEAGWGALPAIQATNTFTFDKDNIQISSETASVSHIYAAVKGMIPLKNQFGLFGKLGYDSMMLASTKNIASDNASGVLLAVGGNYNVNKSVAVTLAYNDIISSNSTSKFNVGYAALGLTYLI